MVINITINIPNEYSTNDNLLVMLHTNCQNTNSTMTNGVSLKCDIPFLNILK